METFQTKAIVLSRQDFRENDLRIVFYTEKKGKLDLVARGAKKQLAKMAGHLEPFCLANIMIAPGKQYNYVGSVVAIDSFLRLKNDFNKLEIAGKAIQKINTLIKFEQTDAQIFYLLEKFLVILDNLKNQNLAILLNAFYLKLISILGYKPKLCNCGNCEQKITPQGNFFSLSQSAIICSQCAKNLNYKKSSPISDNAIKLLRLSLNSRFEKILKIKADDKNLLKQVEKLIDDLLKYSF